MYGVTFNILIESPSKFKHFFCTFYLSFQQTKNNDFEKSIDSQLTQITKSSATFYAALIVINSRKRNKPLAKSKSYMDMVWYEMLKKGQTLNN